MNLIVESLKKEHYGDVSKIYMQGLKTLNATFETEVPSYEKFDEDHIKDCRLIAKKNDEIVGWIVLSPISSRKVFRGVAEVSVYVHEDHKKKGVASRLMSEIIEKTEEVGYWTLESKIFVENNISINLHRKFGFDIVGVRDKMGQDVTGSWRDVLVMERRSVKI